jgi:hypothetical protein
MQAPLGTTSLARICSIARLATQLNCALGWASECLRCGPRTYGLQAASATKVGRDTTVQLNFTVNCVLDIPNRSYTAQVQSVVTPHDEDITQHFLGYCQGNQVPLATEDQIQAAIYEYGKKYYS